MLAHIPNITTMHYEELSSLEEALSSTSAMANMDPTSNWRHNGKKKLLQCKRSGRNVWRYILLETVAHTSNPSVEFAWDALLHFCDKIWRWRDTLYCIRWLTYPIAWQPYIDHDEKKNFSCDANKSTNRTLGILLDLGLTHPSVAVTKANQNSLWCEETSEARVSFYCMLFHIPKTSPIIIAAKLLSSFCDAKKSRAQCVVHFRIVCCVSHTNHPAVVAMMAIPAHPVMKKTPRRVWCSSNVCVVVHTHHIYPAEMQIRIAPKYPTKEKSCNAEPRTHRCNNLAHIVKTYR